jgi:uncharacterized protein (DUF427 family)
MRNPIHHPRAGRLTRHGDRRQRRHDPHRGNHYFPPADVSRKNLEANDREGTCPWKGVASYYGIAVGDEGNEAARLTLPAAR